MTRSLATLLALSIAALAGAGSPDLGDIAYHQAIKDVKNPFRMMCVAAHPDDEDGATLAYYRMLHGVKTIAVIATRGEGGQNEIGPELYNELGVIRTREMKAAAEIEGAELHFLNLPEFGYSKTPEETFEIWGRDVALERMVRVIRETRPHIIITNHGRMKDHGHHQAIGAVVEEAFDAAADETKYPEQIRAGLAPWQVSRLFIRDFRGSEGTVVTDISALDPLRGKTISEIAASALEEHKSQGMKYFIDLLLSSRHQTYYQEVKTKVSPTKAREGVPLNTCGPLFAGLSLPREAVTDIGLEAPEDRQATRAQLFGWLQSHTAWKEGTIPEREVWSKVNRAACVVSELRLRATPSDSLVTAGQDLGVTVHIEDFGESEALLATITLDTRYGLGETGNHRLEVPLHTSHQADESFTLTIPQNASLTVPLAPRLFDPDFLAPQLEVRASVNCKDGKVELSAPIYVDVAPPLTITYPDAPYLLRTAGAGAFTVNILVTNNTPGAYADYIAFEAPEGWQVAPDRMPVSFARENEQRFVSIAVTPPTGIGAGDYTTATGVVGTAMKTPCLIRVADITLPEHRRVGVIQSYDNTFVRTLTKLGIPHDTIALADYRPEVLDTYSAIIVDIRAYQYRPDLVANNAALLDFVQRGGTLLVMYQKDFDWSEDYAPYPIAVSRNRVTREDAPVTLLQPDHALFNTPNVITPQDWDGWIQERGLYFPESWSEHYTPLLDTQDPGESIPPGSCLVTAYGQGTYLYTALGWYRQLRELHPGALRCFVNMLAL